MPAPRVTVLLPARDAAELLPEALASVLAQTYRDFEIVVVDDASRDGTAAVAASTGDPRVRVIALKEPLGVTGALNRGLQEARGEFIARMDADDVCRPERLAAQVAFLDTRPEVGVCGTWVEEFDGARREAVRYPVEHDGIVCAQVFRPGLAHPAVMLRTEAVRSGYDPAFRFAQDYELWTRLAGATRFANIPRVLLSYRLHGASVWSRHRSEQLAFTRRIWAAQLASLGLDGAPANLVLHEALAGARALSGPAELDAAEDWLRRLGGALAERRGCPARDVRDELAEAWLRVCSRLTRFGPRVAARYWGSPFAFGGLGLGRSRLRLFAKAVLGRG